MDVVGLREFVVVVVDAFPPIDGRIAGENGDQAFSSMVTGMAGCLGLYFLGVILWAVGKGYQPLAGLLLGFLGPLGVVVLIAFPSRGRTPD